MRSTRGVFKPLGPVSLNESQRVRLIIDEPTRDSRQSVIESLKGKGHLLGQTSSLGNAGGLPTHDDLQKMLPRLDPPLSKQLLDDRR
jgi:predicted DNA-binding antitoxin AbrB/MazE fold protein